MAVSRLDVDQYEKIVTEYVMTGRIPSGVTIKELLSELKNFNSIEKDFLRGSIEMQLPMDEWAHIGPLLENTPKAVKWAGLAGLTSGVADYQFSSNVYSAARTGAIAFGATFFGQQAHKRYQIKEMWKKREERAKEFLKHLPECLRNNQIFNKIDSFSNIGYVEEKRTLRK
jgi:hypothetical protein